MTRTTTTASLLLAATFALATQAFAQAPSEAQRAAIKSNCRSDYIAHCSSIPPGGAASLECLQKNMSSLSASCASAVRAVEAPAAAAPKTAEEPKAEPKAEPKTRDEGRSRCPPRRKPSQSRKQRAPRSRARRRSRRSRARAAAIIRRCARACRPAAQRRWNAWRRTRPRSRRPAPRRSRPSVVEEARLRLRLVPAAAVVHRLQPRRLLRPRRSCCVRCCRANSCSCCARPAAAMSARCAAVFRPAADGSCNASPRRHRHSHQPARTC